MKNIGNLFDIAIIWRSIPTVNLYGFDILMVIEAGC